MALRTPLRKIEGRHHPLVKEIRSTVRSGKPLANGVVLLETVRLVEDALKGGVPIEKVFVNRNAKPKVQSLIERLPAAAEVYEVSPEIFELLASTRTSQGVIALAAPPQWREKDLFTGSSALVVILAGIQDPGNLGAIIRTAEAFGATGIILTEGSVGPYNAKVIRATAG